MTVVQHQMRQVPSISQQIGDENYLRLQAQHAGFVREIMELTEDLSNQSKVPATGTQALA